MLVNLYVNSNYWRAVNLEDNRDNILITVSKNDNSYYNYNSYYNDNSYYNYNSYSNTLFSYKEIYFNLDSNVHDHTDNTDYKPIYNCVDPEIFVGRNGLIWIENSKTVKNPLNYTSPQKKQEKHIFNKFKLLDI